MQSATETKSSQEWEQVINDLTGKAIGYDTEIAQIVKESDSLALDSQLGHDGAARRLSKLLGEVAARRILAETVRRAIQQAQTRLEAARAAEAEIAERARQKELCALAQTAIRHASEFSAALSYANKAGASLKMIIQNMLSRATPVETSLLDQLLRPGIYMRCAENAGLKNHIEFQGYTGPREHLQPLEAVLADRLARWLPPSSANGKE